MNLSESQDAFTFAFADDLKALAVIRHYNDCIKFQTVLDKINVWSNEWQMKLAPNKCTAVTFYSNIHPIVFQYNIDTNIIPTSDSTVDVGILLNYNLNFTSYISMICSKAMCSSFAISGCLHSSDAYLRYRAFTYLC